MTIQNRVGIWVLSIHDRKENGCLSFDLKDVLQALEPALESLSWIVNFDDWEGEPGILPPDGILGGVMSSGELLRLSQGIYQTIDGDFVGLAPEDVEEEYGDGRPSLHGFAQMKARIAILALDSSFFVVWTKDFRDVQAIKERFKKVIDEDIAKWCPLPPD